MGFHQELWVWSTLLARMSSTHSAGGVPGNVLRKYFFTHFTDGQTNYRRNYMRAGMNEAPRKTISLSLDPQGYD